jgi:cyclophilin family peptidyl-prolyl cis-trans isomerase
MSVKLTSYALLSFGCAILSPLSAQQPTPEPASNVEKLAEQAQKGIFDVVDQKPGALGTSAADSLPPDRSMPGSGLAPTPRITTRGSTPASTGRQTNTFPAPASAPKADDPANWAPDSSHKLAVMEIGFGGNLSEIIIELFPGEAPQTVNNFIDLCESRFYDGLAFHRAIENFLVQTGDPLTSDEDKREQWGTGGEERSIPSEIKRTHRLGSLAMARRGDSVNPSRKSNSSQFYIALGNYGTLDGKYTVFGQVISGIEAVQKISRMPADSNDCPVARIEVKTLRIVDQKGPLLTQNTANGKRTYRNPGASKGFMEKMLDRLW